MDITYYDQDASHPNNEAKKGASLYEHRDNQKYWYDGKDVTDVLCTQYEFQKDAVFFDSWSSHPPMGYNHPNVPINSLADKIVYCSPIDVKQSGETIVTDNLRPLLKTLKEQTADQTPKRILIPIEVNKIHWCAAVIEPDKQNLHHSKIYYVNPFGDKKEGYNEIDQYIMGTLESEFLAIPMRNRVELQHDGYACGPIMCAALTTAKNCENVQELEGKLSAMGNAASLRQKQAEPLLRYKKLGEATNDTIKAATQHFTDVYKKNNFERLKNECAIPWSEFEAAMEAIAKASYANAINPTDARKIFEEDDPTVQKANALKTKYVDLTHRAFPWSAPKAGDYHGSIMKSYYETVKQKVVEDQMDVLEIRDAVPKSSSNGIDFY